MQVLACIYQLLFISCDFASIFCFAFPHTGSFFQTFQDLQKKSQIDTKRQVLKEDREQKEMEKYRQHFGGGPEADRLAMTLKKLKLAYQEGKTMMKRKQSVKEIDTASESGVSDL